MKKLSHLRSMWLIGKASQKENKQQIKSLFVCWRVYKPPFFVGFSFSREHCSRKMQKSLQGRGGHTNHMVLVSLTRVHAWTLQTSWMIRKFHESLNFTKYKWSFVFNFRYNLVEDCETIHVEKNINTKIVPGQFQLSQVLSSLKVLHSLTPGIWRKILGLSQRLSQKFSV